MPGGDARLPELLPCMVMLMVARRRRFIVDNRLDPMVSHSFELGFGLRPAEELYVIKDDPYNIQ